MGAEAEAGVVNDEDDATAAQLNALKEERRRQQAASNSKIRGVLDGPDTPGTQRSGWAGAGAGTGSHANASASPGGVSGYNYNEFSDQKSRSEYNDSLPPSPLGL